jgi:predicted extracellular nuclease
MHMSSAMKTVFFIFLISFVQLLPCQKLIVKWNFDKPGSVPDSGQGSLTTTGGVSFSSYVAGNPSSGKAYGTGSYPAQSQLNEKAGIHITVSTEGLKDIVLKFDQYRSNTSSRKTMVLVSGDGLNYYRTDSLIAASGSTWSRKSVNLQAFKELNNLPEIHIMLVSSFAGQQYAASGPTSTYSAAGTWRFDNIAVYGHDTAKPVVKTKLDISASKITLWENRGDTLKFIFTLEDTAPSGILQKVFFKGPGISNNDYSWIGNDSLGIPSGALSDTLFLKINDDEEVEGNETGALIIPDLDTNIFTGINPSVTLMDDDIKISLIPEVQGKGSSSQMTDRIVAVEGVVTCDLQGPGEQSGFYMQEMVPDGDPHSSDAIFVRDSGAFAVEEGDLVKVTGRVAELFGQTSLVAVGSVKIISSHHVIAPVELKLPRDTLNLFERIECMKVRFTEQLTVTDNYSLGRYGEITVSANGRLFNPCKLLDPNDAMPEGNNYEGASNSSGIDSFQKRNEQNSLLVCDRLSLQDPAPVPFLDTVDQTLRCGSVVDSLEGVLGYGYGRFRLYPAVAHPHFIYAKRPSAPRINGANLKVAGMNVLNYFNGDGKGAGFPAERGAVSAEEFSRQKAKLTSAIIELDADVLGLMEMENDGDSDLSAISDLVKNLNHASGTKVYDYIRDAKGADGNPGPDPIKVAIIYKTSMVRPSGNPQNHNDTAFSGLGRPPLSQAFILKSNGEKFTLIVNHFKSKGCSASRDSMNLDRQDGQGCFNSARKKQAFALIDFISGIIAETGDSDIVILGDFNAYEQEDPLDILRASGLTELSANSYSYIFGGLSGSLDHAFATPSMHRSFISCSKWHVNSDEPAFKDYTLASGKQDLYKPDAFRSSDHDPLMAGFNLAPPTAGLADLREHHRPGVHPMPNDGTFTIDAGEAGDCTIRIYALSGALLFTAANLQGICTVSSGLDPGLYFIVLEGANGTYLGKLAVGIR